jgi:diaminopimelate epimerase
VTSHLFKVEGAGNDFVLGLGKWAARLEGSPEVVRRLCDRRRGIGADGVLALTAESEQSIRLAYRNADGGYAAFCANGTRCAAKVAAEHFGFGTQLVIDTGWGPIPARVEGSSVALDLPGPQTPVTQPEIRMHQSAVVPWLIQVGVPHLVVAVDGLDDMDLSTAAPPLRNHPSLAPAGANVNFHETDSGGVVRVRSWERGVEGETLSCGSGLVAVALIVMAERGERRIEVRPRSQDLLTIEALADPPVCPTRFTGPANIVAEISPTAPWLEGDRSTFER